MADLDLEKLLRDLGASIGAVSAFEERRRASPAEADGDDPYQARRWASTQTTLRAISPDDPARPYVASWVLWLLLGRVNLDTEAALWRQREARQVRLALPIPVEVSQREAVHRLLGATAPELRTTIGRALVETSGEAAAAAGELWARRGEALRRLGGAELEPLLQPLPSFLALRAEAERVLEATDELARASLRGSASWVEALAAGFGHGGGVPWPRQLTLRWLIEPFRGQAGWLDVPRLEVGPLPELRGSSSVLRAFARLGARWADASISRQLPAPLARLPSGLARFRTGALFASLPATLAFLQRALGMTRAEAERARRELGRVTLVAARIEAVRVLLALDALAGDRRRTRQAAADLSARALLRPLPVELALVLPRPSPWSPARLLSFGLGALDAREMREGHDEDWYRNPRAALALRDRLERAPAPQITAEEATRATGALVEALTGVLA